MSNMGKLKRLLSVAAAFAIMVSCLWVFPAGAASRVLSDYTTEQNGDGWYVHKFKSGSYYFLTTVGKGNVSAYPVTVVVPSGVQLSGAKALEQAEKGSTKSGASYTFSEAGTHTLTITAPEEGGVVRYGKFSFTILTSPETKGVSAGLVASDSDYRTVSHNSGASYQTDIQEGEVLDRPGVVIVSSSMKAEVEYNGTKSSYISGKKLTKPGTYKMTFTSSVRGREEKSTLNFSIGTINYKEPDDYSVYFPVDPSKSINPNLADVGQPSVGGWSWETAPKTGLDDWAGDGVADANDVINDLAGLIKDNGGILSGLEDWDGDIDELKSGSGGGSFASGTKEMEVTVMGTNEAEIKPLEVQRVGVSSSDEEDPDEEDSDEEYSDKESSDGKSPGEEDSEENMYTGPGALKKPEEGGEESAPKEVLVELSETYNEQYKIYELSFANKYFFYSNLGDGGITSRSKPAMFDVPANITVLMEKDGIYTPYNNKAPISEPGTYVFYLSVQDGQDPETGERVVYKAVYHFRVEEKEPETETAAESGSQDGGHYGFSGPAFSLGGTDSAGDSASVLQGLGLPEESADAGAKGQLDGLETEESLTGVLDENSTMEDIDALVDDLTRPEETEEKSAFTPETPTGLKEWYDEEVQMFAQELISGTVFHSSVPNGMISYGPVSLTIPQGLTAIAQKDDQPYELLPDTPIKEPGVYRLEFQETRVDYAVYYDMPPYFVFRVVDGPVKDLEVFNAPSHFAITNITRDEETLPVRYNDYVALDKDGAYRIDMISEEWGRQYTIDIEKDTLPPQINLAGVANGVSTGTSVAIEYLSEDIEQVEVYRNGSKEAGYQGGDITTSGNYRIMVYDQAGNVSEYTFQMKYKMNLGSVVAVVLVILLGVGIAMFVRKVKRDVKVR